MTIRKPFRPYKGTVTKNGDQTLFSVTDSHYHPSTGKYTKSDWYYVMVNGLNFPIEKGNPVGYKILPKEITTVTIQKYYRKTQVTIWLDDCEIQDKDGNTIISSIKEGARKVGKALSDVQADMAIAEMEKKAKAKAEKEAKKAEAEKQAEQAEEMSDEERPF